MVIDPINDPEGAKQKVKDSQLPPMGFGSPSDGVISTTLGGERPNPFHTPIPDAVPKSPHLNDLSGLHKYLDNANNQTQGENQANSEKPLNGYASLYKNTPAFNGATTNGNQEPNSEKSKNADTNPPKQGETPVAPASGETSSLGSQTPTESKVNPQKQGSEQLSDQGREALANRHTPKENSQPSNEKPEENKSSNI